MICFCQLTRFQRNLTGILLLAFPGVLICSVAFGFALRFLGLGSTVSFYGLLIIGSLLGSTDPVAVNALLKELGTPMRLNMLLEGESLLNDGVSIVLAFSFRKFYESEPLSTFQIIWNLISLCVGGPLFGLFIGFLFYRWMIKIIKDQVMMVAITFICCFLVFFLCEYPPWNLSGILAIVMASIFLSHQGKMGMREAAVFSVVENVWHFVQFVGESLLFVITGIFVGRQFAVDFNGPHSSEILFDLGKVVIFFVLMNLIRFGMILIFLPFINHKENANEYKLGWKDCVVVAYSGIRGAFPLIICLTIIQNESYPSDFKYVTSLVTVGVIFLGIIFNGMTIKFLIQILDIIHPNQAANSLKKRVLAKIVLETELRISEIREKDNLIGANWRIVDRLCGGLDNTYSLSDSKPRESTLHLSSAKYRFDSFISTNRFEVEGEIRLRILYYLKSEIVKGVKESECTSEAASTLIYACKYAEETSLNGLYLWRNLEGILKGDWVLWTVSTLSNYCPLADCIKSYYTIQMCFHFECVYYFLRLLERGMKKKETLIPLGPQLIKFLDAEMLENKETAERYVANLNNKDPALFQLYQTKRASKEIIHQRLKTMKNFFKEGLLSKVVI